jgi:aryl-alcohol dehydrogenase-like predicted oxidoreductase
MVSYNCALDMSLPPWQSLTGTLSAGTYSAGDSGAHSPRFIGTAAAANQAIADAVRAIALAKSAAPAQVALGSVSAQAPRLGTPVVPIPGTKRVKWQEQNVAALDVRLTPDELAQLDGLADQVIGARY